MAKRSKQRKGRGAAGGDGTRRVKLIVPGATPMVETRPLTPPPGLFSPRVVEPPVEPDTGLLEAATGALERGRSESTAQSSHQDDDFLLIDDPRFEQPDVEDDDSIPAAEPVDAAALADDDEIVAVPPAAGVDAEPPDGPDDESGGEAQGASTAHGSAGDSGTVRIAAMQPPEPGRYGRHPFFEQVAEASAEIAEPELALEPETPREVSAVESLDVIGGEGEAGIPSPEDFLSVDAGGTAINGETDPASMAAGYEDLLAALPEAEHDRAAPPVEADEPPLARPRLIVPAMVDSEDEEDAVRADAGAVEESPEDAPAHEFADVDPVAESAEGIAGVAAEVGKEEAEPVIASSLPGAAPVMARPRVGQPPLVGAASAPMYHSSGRHRAVRSGASTSTGLPAWAAFLLGAIAGMCLMALLVKLSPLGEMLVRPFE